MRNGASSAMSNNRHHTPVDTKKEIDYDVGKETSEVESSPPSQPEAINKSTLPTKLNLESVIAAQLR